MEQVPRSEIEKTGCLPLQNIGCMIEPQHRELLSLTNQELAEIVGSFAQAPYRLRQLLDGLYRQRWSRLEQFTTLSLSFRRQLADSGYSIGQPTIEKRFTSSDGTVRYLIAFPDGQSVETVWMPEGDGGEAGDGSEAGEQAERFSGLNPSGAEALSEEEESIAALKRCATQKHSQGERPKQGQK